MEGQTEGQRERDTEQFEMESACKLRMNGNEKTKMREWRQVDVTEMGLETQTWGLEVTGSGQNNGLPKMAPV